jgi:hypothetical protein
MVQRRLLTSTSVRSTSTGVGTCSGASSPTRQSEFPAIVSPASDRPTSDGVVRRYSSMRCLRLDVLEDRCRFPVVDARPVPALRRYSLTTNAQTPAGISRFESRRAPPITRPPFTCGARYVLDRVLQPAADVRCRMATSDSAAGMSIEASSVLRIARRSILQVTTRSARAVSERA